jgi:hypothetical protein
VALSSRLRCLLAALVTGTCLPSCTLVGLGVGSAVDAATDPVYEDHALREFRPLWRGRPLRVTMKNGSRIEGDYFGARGPIPRDPETYLWVRMPDESVRALPYSDVNSIDVERPEAGWITGMTIGFALDVVGGLVLAHVVEAEVAESIGNADIEWR